MLTAIGLLEQGITDFRIVDKAGDFGGTWYWNRYPGCMCDVESLHLPAAARGDRLHARPMKYAPAHRRSSSTASASAATFDLYPHALFQTEIDDRDVGRRRRPLARHHHPRRPALGPVPRHRRRHPAQGQAPGHRRASTTSRARPSTPPAGTTATPAAARPSRWTAWPTSASASSAPAPRPSRSCPSWPGPPRRSTSSSARRRRSACRANAPTDPEWFSALPPGWQARAHAELHRGGHRRASPTRTSWATAGPRALARTPSTQADHARRGRAELERLDFEVMEALRGRVDEVVDDPEHRRAAQALVRQALQAPLLPRRVPPGLQPAQRPPRRHRRPRRARRSPPRARWWTARSTSSTCSCSPRASRSPPGWSAGSASTPSAAAACGSASVGHDGAHTLHGVLTNGFPNLLVVPLHPGRLRAELPPLPVRARPPTSPGSWPTAADEGIDLDRGHRRGRGRVADAALGGRQGLRPLLRLLHPELSATARAPAPWPPPATSCIPGNLMRLRRATSSAWRDAGALEGTRVHRSART